MGKSIAFSRIILFVLFIAVSSGGGCIDCEPWRFEAKNLTEKEPYPQFIGKKYRLDKDCYLTKSGSSYYINVCGENDVPAALDEKYIGTEIHAGMIIRLLPRGTEFIIRKIIFAYSEGKPVGIRPFVEIVSNKIVANAQQLVDNSTPENNIFKKCYAEIIAPLPTGK